MMNRNNRQLKPQGGAALFVALILLLILTVIGLSSSQRSQLQERMAANIHIQNVAYNAAESGLRAFIAEANGLAWKQVPANVGQNWTGHLNNVNNILRKTRDLNGLDLPYVCYDKNGISGECNKRFIDGKSIEARLTAKVLSDCQQCAGFSIDVGVQCREYLITAIGTVGGELGELGTHSQTHELIAYETTACNN